MEQSKEKKRVVIGISVVGVLAILVIAQFCGWFGDGKASVPNYSRVLLCVECDASFETDTIELNKLVKSDWPDGIPATMGGMSITCKSCDQKTAYLAEKCSECEEIFIPNYNSTDPYECPYCGNTRSPY